MFEKIIEQTKLTVKIIKSKDSIGIVLRDDLSARLGLNDNLYEGLSHYETVVFNWF